MSATRAAWVQAQHGATCCKALGAVIAENRGYERPKGLRREAMLADGCAPAVVILYGAKREDWHVAFCPFCGAKQNPLPEPPVECTCHEVGDRHASGCAVLATSEAP